MAFEWSANARLRTFRVDCLSMAPRSTFAICSNKPVKALPRVQYEKIALGISLSTAPSCYFFHIALAAVL